MVEIKDLFDLDKTIAKELFDGKTYPWEVLDGIKENTTRVYNTKAYLLAALFNVVSTIDNHYAMLVNHDLYGPDAQYQAGKYGSL